MLILFCYDPEEFRIHFFNVFTCFDAVHYQFDVIICAVFYQNGQIRNCLHILFRFYTHRFKMLLMLSFTDLICKFLSFVCDFIPPHFILLLTVYTQIIYNTHNVKYIQTDNL